MIGKTCVWRKSVIELVLPYPISANRYWRQFWNPKVKHVMQGPSSDAKKYKREVAKIVKATGLFQPLAGRVSIDIKLYPHRPLDWQKRARLDPATWDDTVQCLDLDNANKVLLDSLKDVAIEDDKFVRRLTSERMEPDGEARVIVRIEAIAQENIQATIRGTKLVLSPGGIGVFYVGGKPF